MARPVKVLSTTDEVKTELRRRRPMGKEPALAIVRWQRNRNQGLNALIAVHERVDIRERVNFPTIDGMSTIACGTLGKGER